MPYKIFLKTAIAVFLLVCYICLALIFALPNISRDRQLCEVDASLPTVIIDAGHGGEDGGAVGSDGTCEKDLNLEIALILYDMLRAEGVSVVMTRTEDVLLYDRTAEYEGRKKVLDLEARMNISLDNPNAIFISIHMNSFPQKKYHGLQVYYPIESDDSEQLAVSIQSNVSNYLQPDNTRKAKGCGSNIYILDKNPNTAVLIECGFLSNDAECARLNNPCYRQQLSLILCDSIIKFLTVSEKSP